MNRFCFQPVFFVSLMFLLLLPFNSHAILCSASALSNCSASTPPGGLCNVWNGYEWISVSKGSMSNSAACVSSSNYGCTTPGTIYPYLSTGRVIYLINDCGTSYTCPTGSKFIVNSFYASTSGFSCPPPIQYDVVFVTKNSDGTYSKYTAKVNPDGTFDMTTLSTPSSVPFNESGNWSGMYYDQTKKTWHNAAFAVSQDGKINVGLSPLATPTTPESNPYEEATFTLSTSNWANSTYANTVTNEETFTSGGSTQNVTTIITNNPDGTQTITKNYSTTINNITTNSSEQHTSNTQPIEVNVNMQPVVDAINNSKTDITNSLTNVLTEIQNSNTNNQAATESQTTSITSGLSDLKASGESQTTSLLSGLTEGLTENSDDIKTSADSAATSSIDSIGQAVTDDIESIKGAYTPQTFPVDQTFTSKINSLFPAPVNAQDICFTVPIQGRAPINFCIKASTFNRIRELLTYLFAIWTLFTLYAVIFDEPLVK